MPAAALIAAIRIAHWSLGRGTFCVGVSSNRVRLEGNSVRLREIMCRSPMDGSAGLPYTALSSDPEALGYPNKNGEEAEKFRFYGQIHQGR